MSLSKIERSKDDTFYSSSSDLEFDKESKCLQEKLFNKKEKNSANQRNG